MTKNGFMVANLNPEKVSDLLRQCAREIIMPYHGKLEEHQKQFKNDNARSMVTVADHEAEKFLSEKLTALIPGSYVVGEESSEDDPGLINHLKDPDKTVWVIDPVDGTNNYGTGSNTFCVIIALVSGGETKMGWIYDPVNDSMAFAEKGKGAFIDGKKHNVDRNWPVENTHGYSGYRMDAEEKPQNIKMSSLHCSGLEYFRIVKGERAFSLYHHTKPWDHLAGTLLVQEAGGVCSKWDGSPYRPGDQTGGVITAVSKNVWEKVFWPIDRSRTILE